MADEDADLTVRVTTESDTSGVDSATEAVGGFTESAHGAAHEMREFTGSTREGQEAIRGIEAAFRGGAAGIGEMIRGLRALTLIVAHLIEESGPVGILLVLLGVIGGAMLTFSRHTKEASEGLKEATKDASEFKKELAEIKKAAEESFKPITDAIKDINQDFADLDKRMSQQRATSEKLAAAKKEEADAQIDINKQKDLAAAGDDKERAFIERKYAAQKDLADSQDELLRSDQGLLDAQSKLDEAQQKSAQMEDQRGAGQGLVSEAQASYEKSKAEAKRAIYFANEKEEKAAAGVAAVPLRDVASTIASRSAPAREERRKALEEADKKKSDLDQKVLEQTKIDREANKAKDEVSNAQENIDNQRELADVKAAAATDKVSAAMIRLQGVLDRVDVTGGDPEEKLDKEQAREDAKQAKAVEKAQKAEEKAEAKEAATEAKSRAKYMSEVHKEMAKETEAVVKLHEQAKRGASAAHTALRGTRLIDRQLINETSYQASP